MATRSTITLKIKKNTKGKTFHFDENKLPIVGGERITCDNECINKVGDVKIEKNYLTIYHHWDGYPEGVGRTLVETYNEYDTILNLLCGGDASSINGDNVTQYCAWRGEEWNDVKPTQSDEEPLVQQDYTYLFKRGKWYFKSYSKEKWKNLDKYLKKLDEQQK